MSRWTENKRYYSKHGNDIWTTPTRNVYRITTKQKDFEIKLKGKLDYKETLKRMYKAGYTEINICYIGREIAF